MLAVKPRVGPRRAASATLNAASPKVWIPQVALDHETPVCQFLVNRPELIPILQVANENLPIQAPSNPPAWTQG